MCQIELNKSINLISGAEWDVVTSESFVRDINIFRNSISILFVESIFMIRKETNKKHIYMYMAYRDYWK